MHDNGNARFEDDDKSNGLLSLLAVIMPSLLYYRVPARSFIGRS